MSAWDRQYALDAEVNRDIQLSSGLLGELF